MSENLFFDTSKLKYRGNNVIIGKTVRIRFPELVELHDNVIIDDFTYISCGLVMYEHGFIENNCSLMGGKDYKIVIGRHAAITSHTTARCNMLDFNHGLQCNHSRNFLHFAHLGDIILKDHVLVGTHSTIYPNVTMHEGARTSEYTRITKNLDAWGLYYGISAKKIGMVNKESILNYEKLYSSKFNP